MNIIITSIPPNTRMITPKIALAESEPSYNIGEDIIVIILFIFHHFLLESQF